MHMYLLKEKKKKQDMSAADVLVTSLTNYRLVRLYKGRKLLHMYIDHPMTHIRHSEKLLAALSPTDLPRNHSRFEVSLIGRR